MAEEAKEGEAGEGEAKPKGKGKLIIIIVAAVLLIGGGAGAFLMLGGKKADEQHVDEHEEEEKHLLTFELPTFIVNLSESSSFLKVTLLVEYDPEILAKVSEKGGEGHGSGGAGGEEGEGGGKGIPEEFAAREPMIRDAIIRVLSSKKTAEVLTLEGKEQIKEELVEAINEAAGIEEAPVVAVYFTEFIIQ